MMTGRITLVILIMLGALHASGFSLPTVARDDCAAICGSHSKQIVDPEPSCCPLGEAADRQLTSDYCPMSDGPCVCGLDSNQERQPIEPVPLPQRDRELQQMVRGPPELVEVTRATLLPHLVSLARKGSIRMGYSHNQTQAILGVWRR
jgi:hypothetical protein